MELGRKEPSRSAFREAKLAISPSPFEDSWAEC